MLIPMGILAASGAGLTSSYELISTQTLSGTTSTISFSSVPNTYKHLQLRYIARTDRGSDTDGLIIRFNSDTGMNYNSHFIRGNGSSVATSGGAGSTSMNWSFTLLGDTVTASAFSAGILDITDAFSTTKNKTVKLSWGFTTPTSSFTGLGSGMWQNTSQISTITLNAGSGSFKADSRFSLYGIKGA